MSETDPRTFAQALLREADALLDDEGSYHKTAWRVADAGFLIRQLLEGRGERDLIGLDRESGRGVMLPRKVQ